MQSISLSISNIFVYLVSQNSVLVVTLKVKTLTLYSNKRKMIEESVLIWMIVKEAAPDIIKAGGNPIEVNKVK